MPASVTTPAQVASTSAAVICFGVLLWLFVRYLVNPRWSERDGAFWQRTDGNPVFSWVLPGLFVLGGTAGELVALIGWLTGTTWGAT